MDELIQYTFHEILSECYDVQRELEDIRESYEILVSDVELVAEEISEQLIRIRDHLEQVETAFRSYRRSLPKIPANPVPEEMPRG